MKKACQYMDLELNKINDWIIYIDIKIEAMSKGKNVSQEILTLLKSYVESGNPSVLMCLRDIEDELKLLEKIKDKNVIHNIISNFRIKSLEVSKAYNRLLKVKKDVIKSMTATINLKESLSSLQASRKQVDNIRKILKI